MTSKRDISALNETALLSQVVRPIYFLRMDFSSGVKRFHSEIGSRTATHPVFGAETYTGFGDFGSLASEIVESVSAAAQPVKFKLSGVKTSLILDMLTDDYFRRDIDLMLGLDDATGALVDDPVVLWSGYMDKVDISIGELFGEILLTCDSRAADLDRSSDWRFTDEDLQSEFPGDQGGEYIYRMVDLILHWGGGATNFQPAGPSRRPRRRRDRGST